MYVIRKVTCKLQKIYFVQVYKWLNFYLGLVNLKPMPPVVFP